MGIGVGSGRGGARRGSGRPKGVLNRRRPAQFRARDEGQQLPLDYMLKILNDPAQPQARRDRMAVAAAPYLHARLMGNPTAKAAFEMSEEELETVIEREKAFRRGELSGAVVRLPTGRRGR